MPKEKYEPPNPRRNHTILPSSINIVDPNKKDDEQNIFGQNGESNLKYGWTELEITGAVKNLSPNLFTLTHLTVLYLNDNNLTMIPPEINQLQRLTYLDLSSNKLRCLPPQLGDIISLRELHANNNFLRSLPLELGRLFQILVLGLKGNPLAPELLRIYSENNGTQKIMTHLLDNLMAFACLFSKVPRTSEISKLKDNLHGTERDQSLLELDHLEVDPLVVRATRNITTQFRKATSGLTISNAFAGGIPSMIDDPMPPRTFIRVMEKWITQHVPALLTSGSYSKLGEKYYALKQSDKFGDINFDANNDLIPNIDDLLIEEYSTSQDFYNTGRLNYQSNIVDHNQPDNLTNFPIVMSNSQQSISNKSHRSSIKKDFFAVQPDTSDSEIEPFNKTPIRQPQSHLNEKSDTKRASDSDKDSSSSDDSTDVSFPTNDSITTPTSSEFSSFSDAGYSDEVASHPESKVEKLSLSQLGPPSSQITSQRRKPDNIPQPVPKYVDDTSHSARTKKSKQKVVPYQPSTPTSFTIMCYNVLCDKYATRQLYAYCPTWAMGWDYRKERIKQELADTLCDIICLQEVETEQFIGFFEPEMAKLGYSGIFAPKSRAKTMGQEERKYVDGCAIFYRRQRFRLLKCHVVEFNQVAIAKAEGSQNMLNRVMTKDNIGLTALLETVDGTSIPNNQSLTSKNAKRTSTSRDRLDSSSDTSSDTDNEKKDDESGETRPSSKTRKVAAHTRSPRNVNDKFKSRRRCKSKSQGKDTKKPGCRKRNLLVVSTAHVHWDPEYSDVKIIQAMMIIHELKTFIRECYEEFVLGFGSTLASALTTTTTTIYGSQYNTSMASSPGRVMNNSYSQFPPNLCNNDNSDSTSIKDLSRTLSLKEKSKILLGKHRTKDVSHHKKRSSKEAEEVTSDGEDKKITKESPSHHDNLKYMDSTDNMDVDLHSSKHLRDESGNPVIQQHHTINNLSLEPNFINKRKRTFSENALTPITLGSKSNSGDIINVAGSDGDDLSGKQRLYHLSHKRPYYHYKRYFERRCKKRRERQRQKSVSHVPGNRLSNEYNSRLNKSKLDSPKQPHTTENSNAKTSNSGPLVDILPLILCGDLNSLPDSGVLEFLLTGKLDVDHCEFKDFGYKTCLAKLKSDDIILGTRAKYKVNTSTKLSHLTSNSTPNTPEKRADKYSKSRIDTSGLAEFTDEGGLCQYSHSFKLASAYDPSIMPFTNFTYDFCGVLDYILHSRKFLVPIKVLGPLDQNWINRNKIVGAPHPFIPSDHFPIVAEYDFRKI